MTQLLCIGLSTASPYQTYPLQELCHLLWPSFLSSPIPLGSKSCVFNNDKIRNALADHGFGLQKHLRYMGLSKNRGTWKWMVYSGKSYDLGVPLLLKIPISSIFLRFTCFFSPVGWDNGVLYPIPKGSQVHPAMDFPNNRRLAMKLSTWSFRVQRKKGKQSDLDLDGLLAWPFIMGILATPPKATPPKK